MSLLFGWTLGLYHFDYCSLSVYEKVFLVGFLLRLACCVLIQNTKAVEQARY